MDGSTFALSSAAAFTLISEVIFWRRSIASKIVVVHPRKSGASRRDRLRLDAGNGFDISKRINPVAWFVGSNRSRGEFDPGSA